MRKLAVVVAALIAGWIVIWRMRRRDYRKTMVAYSDAVLADIDWLQGLIEERWPLKLGPSDEAKLILNRWFHILCDTDRIRFQVPSLLERSHDQWWNPVRQYMVEVDEGLDHNDKEETSAKLLELRTKVLAFKARLGSRIG